GVAGGKVNAEGPAGGGNVPLQLGERDARAGGGLTGDGIEFGDRVEAREREHDFAAARHAAADQAGVAALRDDRDMVPGTSAYDLAHFVSRTGADDRQRRPVVATSPVGLVGGTKVGIEEDVSLADDGRDFAEERGGH